MDPWECQIDSSVQINGGRVWGGVNRAVSRVNGQVDITIEASLGEAMA